MWKTQEMNSRGKTLTREEEPTWQKGKGRRQGWEGQKGVSDKRLTGLRGTNEDGRK